MVCDYVALHWPGVIFNSDLAGQHTNAARAGKNTRMRSGAGFPDWFLAEPRGDKHGLFLELKRNGINLHKKNGEWVNPHVANQAAVLTRLDELGYGAWFAIGYDQAIEIIDEYMAL